MITAGSLFTITSQRFNSRPGAHIARALVDLDFDALEAGYLETLDGPSAGIYDDQYLFVAWLIERGMIEPVDHVEVYLGDRNFLELEIEPPFRSLADEIRDAPYR